MYKINNAYAEDWFVAWAELFKERVTPNLVVTSPPYYNARKYGGDWDYFKSPDEWEEFCVQMLTTLNTVLAEDGVIWWNTGSGYKDSCKMINIYRMIDRVNDHGLFLIDEIPWIKTSFLPKSFQNRPYPAWEHNYIFAKNPKLVRFYVDNVRMPYAESTLKRLKYPVGNLQADEKGEFKERKMVKPNPLGKAPPNYLQLKVDTTKRDHPAPMAPELANWAIRAYSKEGDLVLDPMCGVGTTLIEAMKLSRNFLGFDINEEYVGEAVRCLK